MTNELTLMLPYPPSLNHYWRNVRGKTLISDDGRKYRRSIEDETAAWRGWFKDVDRLAVHIVANPPDRRRRDLDNVCKALLDALAHVGVYRDDSQIDDLRVVRGQVGINSVWVTIMRLGA